MDDVEWVNTHELCDGDLVLSHGMRIRLSERRETSHAVDKHSPTLHFRGDVENMSELIDPDTHRVVWPLTGLLPRTGPEAAQWSVQGNGLARWCRVIPNDLCETCKRRPKYTNSAYCYTCGTV